MDTPHFTHTTHLDQEGRGRGEIGLISYMGDPRRFHLVQAGEKEG